MSAIVKSYTISEIMEMNQKFRAGPPGDADGAKAWHEWYDSEEWRITIQACRFAFALGASSDATIYPSKVAELAREFAKAEPIPRENGAPTPFIGEPNQRTSGKATIIFHGGMTYSSNGSSGKVVSSEMHHMLQQFLDKKIALKTKEIKVENASRVAKQVEKKFPHTVVFPGHRKTGYLINVQSNVLIDDRSEAK